MSMVPVRPSVKRTRTCRLSSACASMTRAVFSLGMSLAFLAQWFYGVGLDHPFGQLPVGFQILLVDLCPCHDQFMLFWRQFAMQRRSVEGVYGFVLLVLRVEVGRLVVVFGLSFNDSVAFILN